MTQADIQASIRKFVITELIAGDAGERLKNDDSLFQHEGIDSVSILQLLAFVESQFDVRFQPQEVNQANFDSIERLAACVRKLASEGEQQEELAVSAIVTPSSGVGASSPANDARTPKLSETRMTRTC